MNPDTLPIGVYCLAPYAHSDAHLADLKACSIDFVAAVPPDRDLLDRMHRLGLGAFVADAVPGWWGGDGSNAGTMAARQPLSAYQAALDAFVDHPAIWAIDCGDEPSAADFAHCGQILSSIARRCPGKFGYLNLNPNYGWTAANTPAQIRQQLGTDTYADYIARYCAQVDSPYISYDHYLYASDVPRAFANLAVVADACRDTGRQFWIVLQVNSHREDTYLSTNMLRFQAFSAMAFGARQITWACYTAGWWYNQVLDGQGEKTQQYDKLKTVNAEIKALAAPYMTCRWVDAHFLGAWGEDPAAVKPPVQILNTPVFTQIQTDGKLLVGELAAKEPGGPQGCFFFAADDPYDTSPRTTTVTFKTNGHPVRAFTTGGELPLPQGDTIPLTLRSNQALLLMGYPET